MENKYTNIRKILLPVSYSIILIALTILIYHIMMDSIISEDIANKIEHSIIPININSAIDLDLHIDSDINMKAMSYFNLATNTPEQLEKSNFYLQSIRALNRVIANSIMGDESTIVDSKTYYQLAYSYLLFGEQYLEISLNYFLSSERMNLEDKLLYNYKEGRDKLYILELYEIVASIYFQLGQYINTIKYFEKAMEINPNEFFYHFILGQSYDNIGKYELAYYYYKLLSTNENNINYSILSDIELEKIKELILIQKYKLLYLMEDYLGSIRVYEKYIAEYGETAESRYTVGKIYESLSFIETDENKQREYIDKAINEWKKSIELRPNYGRAMLKLWRYNVINK